MAKYYVADTETSAKIIVLLNGRETIFAEARRLAKEVGADPKTVYFSNGFGSTSITGFIFKSHPDAKSWKSLKGTSDGWSPRAKSDLSKKMSLLRSHAVADVCKLIGMELIGPDMTIRSPGIRPVDDIVYLSVPDDVIPKGCHRITDVEFEQRTVQKPKKASKRKSAVRG